AAPPPCMAASFLLSSSFKRADVVNSDSTRDSFSKTFDSDLRVRSSIQSRKRNCLSHVRQSTNPCDCSLDAKAKSRMGERSISAQVVVPTKVFFAQIVLFNFSL